jgi:hypothetical protein
MRYQVQEFARRWYTVRTFSDLQEAQDFAAWIGKHKSRILQNGKPIR